MGNSCCVIVADAYAPEHMQWLDHPARADWEPAVDLGAGAFSEVVLCRHRKSRRLSALKVVFTAETGQDAETREMLLQEGALLMELDHPHLVKCYEVIPGERATVFRLEYLRGPNVLDGLARRHAAGYSERDAAGVFAQLASAVAYLHEKKVIHRDIKPENLVYAQRLDAHGAVFVAAKAPGAAGAGKENGGAAAGGDSAFAAAPTPPPEAPIVKLVDLGMAWRDVDPAHPDTGALGSAGFVAPEVAAGGAHTPAMDVFSMGVLLFVMLVGRKPFNMSDCEGLGYAKLALADAPGLKDPRWLDLSPDAKDLLMGMLAYDPRRRLSAAGVLAHEWVRSGGGATVRPLGADVALGAATVAEMRRLRFLTSGVVATQRRVAAAGGVGAGAGGAGAARAGSGSVRGGAEAYSEALRRAQKREASARGGRGVAGLAQRITARALTNVHDSGASVHGHPLLEASVRGGGAYHSGSDGSDSRSSRAGAASAAADAAGMRRSGTALLLSELARGGSGPMRRSGSVDRLTALGGAVSAYLEVSVRGGRRLGSFAVGTSQASLGSQEREAAPAAAPAPALAAPPVPALAARLARRRARPHDQRRADGRRGAAAERRPARERGPAEQRGRGLAARRLGLGLGRAARPGAASAGVTA
jgi:calcium/calmodulin-dependent protein kinase I